MKTTLTRKEAVETTNEPRWTRMRRSCEASPHISWSVDRDLEVLSLTPCFSWVKTASKEGGTVSTVSTDCCKPLKRFWRRCHRLTQLKQGVNENQPVFGSRLRDMRA